MTTPIEHPRWCDATRCTAGPAATGMHRSRWFGVGETGRTRWNLALAAGVAIDEVPGSGRPWMDVAIEYPSRDGGPSERVDLALSAELAAELGETLLDLAAKGGADVHRPGVALPIGPGLSGPGGGSESAP